MGHMFFFISLCHISFSGMRERARVKLLLPFDRFMFCAYVDAVRSWGGGVDIQIWFGIYYFIIAMKNKNVSIQQTWMIRHLCEYEARKTWYDINCTMSPNGMREEKPDNLLCGREKLTLLSSINIHIANKVQPGTRKKFDPVIIPSKLILPFEYRSSSCRLWSIWTIFEYHLEESK